MRTILIPTDFNSAAPDCIPALCSRFEGNEIEVIFFHMFKLSDSESELMMLSRRSSEFELVDDRFYEKCDVIRERCPSLRSVKVEFFYGSTMGMFRNFLESHEVDYIMNPVSCAVKKIHKYSVDPAVLVGRCGLPVIDVVRMVNPLRVEHEPALGKKELAEVG
ncbi:hypothetical protein [Arcticibacter sp. MXS-1]|uniref:hypothetical protein n=1 Tax=Arcticibacter sp. MXS-1 TaxID=3341726 RepID=UPI0035A8B456